MGINPKYGCQQRLKTRRLSFIRSRTWSVTQFTCFTRRFRLFCVVLRQNPPCKSAHLLRCQTRGWPNQQWPYSLTTSCSGIQRSPLFDFCICKSARLRRNAESLQFDKDRLTLQALFALPPRSSRAFSEVCQSTRHPCLPRK